MHLAELYFLHTMELKKFGTDSFLLSNKEIWSKPLFNPRGANRGIRRNSIVAIAKRHPILA